MPFNVENLRGKTVKVGYRTLRFEMWDGWDAVRCDRYGECDYAAGIIRLAPQMDGQKAAQTILHEILHAVWTSWGMDGDKKVEEEKAVTVHSSGLATAMIDNPELFMWISGALKGES